MTKPKAAPRARYTLEFKQEAVRLVEGGQSIAGAARTLGMVNRQFVADAPNHLCAADMTYVPAWQGLIYLATVIDVWSRLVDRRIHARRTRAWRAGDGAG